MGERWHGISWQCLQMADHMILQPHSHYSVAVSKWSRSGILVMHGDMFRAHARKFNHELVLQTVHMRTESKTAIVLYTVHVCTVYNKKRSLIAVHCTCMENNGQQADIHCVHMRTERNGNAPYARTNRKGLKRVRHRAHLLIVCNSSKLAELCVKAATV